MAKTTPPKKPATAPTKERIAWHPAFYEAIQMELGEYSHVLEFAPEQQLTTEPLRIDVVIIKKTADVEIKKNIASIFRTVNILEYKSPGDYVSVQEFYKAYAYACLYVSSRKANVSGLTLTFVGSRKPRKLIDHLTGERKFTVEEKWPGIYIISGDVLPIQIIDSGKLSEDENLWLKGLDNQLDARRIRRIADKIAALGKESQIWAYLDAIARANEEALQEAYEMSDTAIASLKRTFQSGGVTGADRHWLTINEMPSHSHRVPSTGGQGTGFAWQGFNTLGAHTEATGGNQPHNNVPPTLPVRYWRRVA